LTANSPPGCAGAGLVLDDRLLAEALGELLRDQPAMKSVPRERTAR